MKRMQVTVCTLAVCLGVATLGFGASACSGSNASSSSSVSSVQISSSAASSASSSSSASKQIATLGQGPAKVQVTNATGYDVTGIRVKAVGEEDFSDTNTFGGLAFSNGQTATLAYTGTSDAQAYDVMLLTSVDSKISVKSIDLAHMQDIAFHFDYAAKNAKPQFLLPSPLNDQFAA